MTDTLTDDDIIEVRSSNHKSTTTRRPMFIETEVRTDTVTTRRMASVAANRSVHDVLDSTKSPTHDLQSTSYTYAHSNSYAPSSRTTSYDVPVMARRNLHNENQNGVASKVASLFSPSQFISTVRSQLSNGYDAIRNGIANVTGYNQGATTSSSSHDDASGGARLSRSSSQSSASGSRATGYNLRSRPVHSTPRDNDNEQAAHQRKVTTRHRKDNQHQEDVNDEGDEHKDENLPQKYLQQVMRYSKNILQTPITIFNAVWDTLRSLPWWLLIPLLIFLTIYALPMLACKPLEQYQNTTVNEMCRKIVYHIKHIPSDAFNFIRRHTYDRGVRNAKRLYRSAADINQSLFSSLNDIYSSFTNSIRGSVRDVKNRVTDAVETTTDNAKEYYEVGLQKINSLIEDLKQEREKFRGAGQTLKPDQEKEFTEMIRKLIDEYAADETGQADYALEANGGKIVDVRCQEYTDEPRQHVVKFLGIPIVHMSKQPDIIIKHGRMPGQCFPFKGDRGSIVIRLAVPVIPTEFVLEHLSKSISVVGHINSAPNNFTVYALKDKTDKEGMVLGRYYYDAENGPTIQRFKPQIPHASVVEYIEIQITSNWGNPSYTCLYRFRVHGDLQSVSPTAA